ncbi:MAG: hypothetical protein ACUVYA_20120 [Planctomycetota bacterium]
MRSGKEGSSPDIDAIVIRSWPKAIFFYPVLVTCFVCGAYQRLANLPPEAPFSELAGLVFFIVFVLNVLVIAFEFSRFKTLALVFFLIALVFLLLYLSTRYSVFQFLRDLFAEFHLSASSSLYFALGTYFLVLFAMIWVNTRFNYWIIRSNEIVHKEGFLGDTRRFPSPNLKLEKEIPDVFEWLLLRSGRIVLYPSSEKQAIALEHVIGVNRAEKAIQNLLSTLAVEIERGGLPAHHEGDGGT